MATPINYTTPAVLFPEASRVTLSERPLKPLPPDGALVRTHWSLLSTGTEMTVLHQKYAAGTHWDNWVRFPFWPGYSCAGTLVAVGEEVEGWKPGDRVACRGSHAALTHVEAHQLRRVPDGLGFDAAAWVILLRIAQAGFRTAAPSLGDRVVVVGCGILGQLLVQLLRLAGCEKVVAVDTEPSRLKLAEASGAIAVQGLLGDASEEVIAAMDGALADVVLDATGATAVLPAALPLARDFGRVVLLGDTGFPEKLHLTRDVMTRGVRVMAAHDFHFEEPASRREHWDGAMMEDYGLRLLDRGDLDVSGLVSHRFHWAGAAEAYDVAADPAQPNMGLLLDWRDALPTDA